MYIFRIPYDNDEENGLDPEEQRLLQQPAYEEKLAITENAAGIENSEDAESREQQASDLLPNDGSNLPVNSAAQENDAVVETVETVATDAAPMANDLLDDAAALQIRLLSVNPVEVQPVTDPAANEDGVSAIDAATESFDAEVSESNTVNEAEVAPLNDQPKSEAVEATTEEQDANWDSPANEAEEAEQFDRDLYLEERAPQNSEPAEQASFLDMLNAKLQMAMNSELAQEATAQLQQAREQFSKVVREYRFDQLAANAANEKVVASNEVKVKDWQVLLSLARGLRELGSLAESASRHLEDLVHDGIQLQADAHSDSVEVRK